jgi:hypothetical protein
MLYFLISIIATLGIIAITNFQIEFLMAKLLWVIALSLSIIPIITLAKRFYKGVKIRKNALSGWCVCLSFAILAPITVYSLGFYIVCNNHPALGGE